MAGLVIVFYRASGQSFSAAVGWHRYRWRESGAAGLLLLPATLVLMFVALAATAALSPPELAVDRQVLVKTAGSAVKDGNFSVLAAVVVTAVVIAPLAEEALFRGFLYPVAKRYLHPAAAALIVSLLFGFAHSPLIVVPSLALLGVVLIIVYEATGSLRVPIILHGLFNGLQLGFIVLKGGGIA
jgi:membrane protease YdiL (CAAX protease family)